MKTQSTAISTESNDKNAQEATGGDKINLPSLRTGKSRKLNTQDYKGFCGLSFNLKVLN